MLAILSTIQLLLAIVLVLLGVCGNPVIPFISYRTTLRCPHITVLAALDFIATLLGPGLTLVSIVMDPNWLAHNKTLCQSLSFLSSLVLITSFLVLFFLAVFCQKVRHNIPSSGKHLGKTGESSFLAMCLLTGLLLGVQTFLGWGVSTDLHLVPYCTLFTPTKVVAKKDIFYLTCSFMVPSLLTIVLAVRAMKQRQLYPVQLFWERHKYEEKMNDPEMTTVASVSSSNHSRATVTSIRSFWSRRSSGRRSTILSVVASPLVSRKSSQQSRLTMQESVLLDVLRLAHQNVLRMAASAKGTNEADGGKEASEMSYPGCAADSERTPSSRTSRSWSSPPRDPFVITPYKLPILPLGKKIFQSPCFLPKFKALQQQRSLSRLLLLKCCVTALCYLPLYTTVGLLLFSVQYPQELHLFIQWLIFLPSCIAPLFPLCHTEYRRVLGRAACFCLKTCACGYQTETAEPRDVEFKIEGTQQVRLMAVRPLKIETLREAL